MRLAFVIQRYGLEVNGGAEMHCRLLAERLAKRHEVEVFATRALDYLEWRNHYPEGTEVVNGLPVHRYAVKRPRNARTFASLSNLCFHESHTREEEEAWVRENGPFSPALVKAVARARDRFDRVLFYCFRYYHSYHGVPAVRERAILVPTAEEDPAVHLGDEEQLRLALQPHRQEGVRARRRPLLIPWSAGHAPRVDLGQHRQVSGRSVPDGHSGRACLHAAHARTAARRPAPVSLRCDQVFWPPCGRRLVVCPPSVRDLAPRPRAPTPRPNLSPLPGSLWPRRRASRGVAPAAVPQPGPAPRRSAAQQLRLFLAVQALPAQGDEAQVDLLQAGSQRLDGRQITALVQLAGEVGAEIAQAEV